MRVEWLWCSHTSGLSIVDGEHVDCEDLKHSRTSQRRGAMLEQGLELLQHTSGHSWEALHPTRPGCYNKFLGLNTFSSKQKKKVNR